ncbi:MAG: flippase-like domain-containing protein [Lachnospiraceae bacterium]|nr:flippase-like domain-containing protein [Lachnospiraceae bacterium]
MAALAGLTIYIIAKEFGLSSVIDVLKSINPLFLIPAVLCMFMFSLGEALNIRLGLKLSGYKTGLLSALKYAYTGFFFSSITPSASGGQPAQIYVMHKDRIKVSHASFSLLLELIGYETASITIASIGLIVSLVSPLKLFEGISIGWVLVLGFLVNFILLTGLLLIMFSNKAVKAIACAIIKICSLFSKDKKIKSKLLKTFAEYRLSANRLKNNKGVLLKVILISLLQFGAYHSITYFCYRSFGLSERNLLEIMSLQGLLFTSVSCIPLPGSSGAMEGGFGLLFRKVFSEGIIGSAIVLCRLVSFALPLVLSGLFLLIAGRSEKSYGRIEESAITGSGAGRAA